MSENVELVRSIYADWERGDWSSAAWAHPEIKYVMVDEPGERTVTGLAAMTDAWRGFLTSWRDYRVEPVEYRELDAERVVVIVRAFGQGAASGVDLGSMGATRMGLNLFDVRDGKVTRLTAYFDAQRGLADLGLAE
jgi:ketosteroid isomerase-like protein